MKTEQEIFDIVWNGLKSQGFKRSVKLTMNSKLEDQYTCMYRGKDGMKCAAGWLIPDEKYSTTFEFVTVTARNLAPVLKELELYDQLPFIRTLQSIHDCNEVPSEMERMLRDAAKNRNLTIPE